VDINTIRAWLGHVSIDTTNIYAEVDLQRKAEVLAHSNARNSRPADSHGQAAVAEKGFLTIVLGHVGHRKVIPDVAPEEVPSSVVSEMDPREPVDLE
jgi:hypothetical protein